MAIEYGDGSDSNTGRIVQVVSAHKTNHFSTTSTSWTSTGLEASISPKSSDSKLLILVDAKMGMASGNIGYVRLYRGNNFINYGDAHSSTLQCTSVADGSGCQHDAYPASAIYLDSPATTSSTTYKIKYRGNNGNTVRINRAGSNRSSNDGVFASSLTLMEIAV